MKRVLVAALAAGLSVTAYAIEAQASACNQVKTVQIHFHHGATCWTYNGTGNTFVGLFRGDQKITISAVGPEQEMGANGQLVTHSAPRDVAVTFKGAPATAEPQLSNGQMVTPASGTYTFTLFPCAIWGTTSRVQICADA